MMINVYCDGGARGNPGPGAGAFLVYNQEQLLVRQGRHLGKVTNNVAEYNAVIAALTWVLKNANPNWEVRFFLDSQLVVNQLTGKFKIKDKDLINLVAKVKTLERNFSGKVKYFFVPRSRNKAADFLVNKVLDGKNLE